VVLVHLHKKSVGIQTRDRWYGPCASAGPSDSNTRDPSRGAAGAGSSIIDWRSLPERRGGRYENGATDSLPDMRGATVDYARTRETDTAVGPGEFVMFELICLLQVIVVGLVYRFVWTDFDNYWLEGGQRGTQLSRLSSRRSDPLMSTVKAALRMRRGPTP